MKVHICFPFNSLSLGGGGAQFLRTLRNRFVAMNCYTENPDEAEAVFFNSHHDVSSVVKMKRCFPGKIFIHRLDGPMKLYNNSADNRDRTVYAMNGAVADGTVYQSHWSRMKNNEAGIVPAMFETVILNASDPEIFNTVDRQEFSVNRRCRIVMSSWSSNFNKGFEVYQWLDAHLDFSRYEVLFIGRSPVSFTNIRLIAPLDARDMARELKKCDIYLTASRKDPCSNALVEALHCGLPALALNDGGHPELVGKGGLTFDVCEEIPGKLDLIRSDYSTFQAKIALPGIEDTASAYLMFADMIARRIADGEYIPKKAEWWKCFALMLTNAVVKYGRWHTMRRSNHAK